MAQRKGFHVVIIIVLGSFLSVSLGSAPGIAQSDDDQTLSQGLPGRRIGGGTRTLDGAVQDGQPLTALLPESNLAMVTAEHPALLFYVPQTDGPQTIEFVLRNTTDHLVYETTFEVPAQGGIVTIDLHVPQDAFQLAVNRDYQWYFSIVAEDRAKDISVDGWVRRIDLKAWMQRQDLDAQLADRLAQATEIERVRLLYQDAHLWNEALLNLYGLTRSQPDNLALLREWSSLLDAVGLEALQGEISARVLLASHP